MAAVEVTSTQSDQVREVVAEVVEAAEVAEFENEDLDVLWINKFRTVTALQKATREALMSVLRPGLVGYLKPDAAGEHWGSVLGCVASLCPGW